ncbi:TIM barrel protein [Galbibacter mesophilus]|uniref:TIM barrel protein n=1 Tax=Galbibacter mesophilus TaxID=379069 RepID=UPI00191FCBFA|nr:TIM barrel protein [Galbibacter mesophilus]MCM5663075.1 sugar phosphate isomerase/epimerase [Galbibacter mesophilus]
MIEIGIKSDPIQYRYSFEWLFNLMNKNGIKYLQLGSFFELYSVNDDYFLELKSLANQKGIIIKSVFTAHRELGGFFTNNQHLEKVARSNFERLIHVASLLGADYCGSNPGAVYRDKFEEKDKGIQCYLSHMKELSSYAKQKGLKALTMEPMSSLAEPPTTPNEMDFFINELQTHHSQNPNTTVPTYLCGDISHGLCNSKKELVHSNIELFKHGLPKMAEFHFKNTDSYFNSTFGFSSEEIKSGIIDLTEIKSILESYSESIPVDDMIGYLEIGGPKTGRDYSDNLLEDALSVSLQAIKKVFV